MQPDRDGALDSVASPWTTRPAAELRLLGGATLRDGDARAIQQTGRKSIALLAYLLLAPDLRASREKLADLLWADRTSEQARNCLRQTVSVLRSRMAASIGDVFISERDVLGVRPGVISCDARDLLDLTAGPGPVDAEMAGRLYRGPFLDGFFSGSQAFEEWASERRDWLQTAVIQALHQSARTALPHEAIAIVKRLLALDPMREASHQIAMEVYAANGQRDQALRQFEACRQMMRDEFGVAPSAETDRIVERILAPPVTLAAAHAGTGEPAARRPPPASGEPQRPTVHVTGFANLTGDGRRDALAAALQDAVVVELTQARNLVVLSGAEGETEAQYGISGTVTESGDALRATVRLVHRPSGRLVSAEKFGGDASRPIEFADMVAECVALLTRFELLQFGWHVVDMTPPDDVRIRMLLLRSHYQYYELNPDSLLQAVRLAEEAVGLAPSSLRAQRMLSLALSGAIIQGAIEKTRETVDRTIDAARGVARAVPDDVFSRCVLGWALSHDGLHEEAIEELRHAIQLNPLYATTHSDIAEHYALMGFVGEALSEVNEAIRLSPHDPVGFWRHQNIALARFAAGEDAAALESARRLIREKPGLLRGALLLAAAAAALGLRDEATQAVRYCLRQRPQLRVDNVAPGFMPRFVPDAHHERFLAMLKRAGLPD